MPGTTHAIPAAAATGSTASDLGWAPLAAIAVIWLWIAVACAINPGQFADSIEQFNWAHSMEWGYWKHPPLTTWLFGGLALFTRDAWWTPYLAAALCNAGIVWFMWKLALRLVTPQAAALAILMLPLHHVFSWRAQIYNHNTTLLLTVSAFTWAAVRAVQTGRRRDWVLAGVLAGFALLAKYQAAVAIAAVAAGAWRVGALRERRNLAHAAAAALAGVLVFMPHVGWAAAHGWPTLHYVEGSAPVLAPALRLHALTAFFATQVGMMGMMLLACALLAFLPGTPRPAAGEPPAHAPRWIWTLILVPAAVLVLVVLVGGVKPAKYWGVGTLQFVPLLLAMLVAHRSRVNAIAVTLAISAVSTLGSVAYYVHQSEPDAPAPHSADRLMPASRLAEAVLRDWRAHSACPLRYVIGDGFTAGLVSAYSGQYPQVLEDIDFDKSPWIDRAQLREDGAVLVTSPQPLLPLGAQAGAMEVPHARKQHGTAWVQWTIVPPQHDCQPQIAGR